MKRSCGLVLLITTCITCCKLNKQLTEPKILALKVFFLTLLFSWAKRFELLATAGKSTQHDNEHPSSCPLIQALFQSLIYPPKGQRSLPQLVLPALPPLLGLDMLEDCSLVRSEPSWSTYPLRVDQEAETSYLQDRREGGEVLPLMNARTHEVPALIASLASV